MAVTQYALLLSVHFEFVGGRKKKKSDSSCSTKMKHQGCTCKEIYTKPKQLSHRSTTALTAWYSLEHCNSSFPETDLSQATQRVGPDGDTGTNWCPLVAPDFSFPSFTSLPFTWNTSHNIYSANIHWKGNHRRRKHEQWSSSCWNTPVKVEWVDITGPLSELLCLLY